MTQFRVLAVVLTIVCAAASAACDEEPAAPSEVPIGVPVVESFVGTVAVNGSAFYSFTVPTQGAVSLALISVTENGQPSEARLGLNVGTPIGTGCTGTPSVVTGAGSSPQFTQIYPPGVYCARVSDTGLLTGPVSFAVNIARPR
jgi:hypothetical protein